MTKNKYVGYFVYVPNFDGAPRDIVSLRKDDPLGGVSNAKEAIDMTWHEHDFVDSRIRKKDLRARLITAADELKIQDSEATLFE